MSTNSNTDRLIVIEGLDGSGKATQAALLAESLTAAGTPVRRISFPDYAHKSSIPVQMYLNGEVGSLEGSMPMRPPPFTASTGTSPTRPTGAGTARRAG